MVITPQRKPRTGVRLATQLFVFQPEAVSPIGIRRMRPRR
jgi:hypothetical protein